MSVGSTTEHDELRSVLRRFLDEKSSSEDVRRLIASAETHDTSVWEQMSNQLGLQGLVIPEEFGGAGFGPVELGIVLEEMGRALLVAPYFGTVALAAQALVLCDDGDISRRWLPEIASGSVTATVAIAEDDGSWTADPSATARRDGDDWRLYGTRCFVIDGATADLLVVVAAAPDGPGVFVVEPGASGVARTRVEWLDLTRELAVVGFDAVRASRVSPSGGFAAWRSAFLDRALAALAAEQAGGAARCLEMAVDYAKVREQFGRPIGSFQAIKHMCARVLIEVEAAHLAAAYAGSAVVRPGREASVAATVAAAQCSAAYTSAAKECLQVHGGIGYTWEHDTHLHLRRAKASESLLGRPQLQRSRLADLVEI
ncbi:MAG: acyl-CoA dehydrogenase family protein [Nocardioides sp.]|uniref:acyl-CoA dehydrogenase family protein n=1 Tax=Nocardioides sp. TaxID=35761 RepID=UPI0039E38595